MSTRQTRNKSKSSNTEQIEPIKIKSSKQELSSDLSELAGQKKMMKFLGKEKPSSDDQKGDKAAPEATPTAKQEDFILTLNDKIDRILERLGDVDTRTKLIEQKLACMLDRLSTVENKLNAVETKAEHATEQATAVRVENGSLEVRMKKLELDMQKKPRRDR